MTLPFCQDTCYPVKERVDRAKSFHSASFSNSCAQGWPSKPISHPLLLYPHLSNVCSFHCPTNQVSAPQALPLSVSPFHLSTSLGIPYSLGFPMQSSVPSGSGIQNLAEVWASLSLSRFHLHTPQLADLTVPRQKLPKQQLISDDDESSENMALCSHHTCELSILITSRKAEESFVFPPRTRGG